MCWRDDIVTHRTCIACGRRYYGDLGHRNCPGFRKPTQPAPDPHELARWADDGGVPASQHQAIGADTPMGKPE